MECSEHKGTLLREVTSTTTCPSCHLPVTVVEHYQCVACGKTYDETGAEIAVAAGG